MTKVQNFLSECVKWIFIGLIFVIFLVNLHDFHLDNSEIMYYMLLLLILGVALLWFYKKEIIGKKIIWSFVCVLFIIGVIIRIYLINSLDFNLSSDFEFVYENANSILNKTAFSNVKYLSYNGYSYIYSLMLSILFAIFGESLKVILYFNLFCQILSVLILYKIIRLKSSKETAGILSTVFFLLPTIIFCNLLDSTETPFLVCFFVSIYVLYKIIDDHSLKLANFVKYAGLGVIVCLTNFTRPVMLIFVIAFIIYFILKTKHWKELILIVVTLLGYYLPNIGINALIEKGIGTNLRSGALGWSIYFGANKDYCGSWSPEDSEEVFDILDYAEKELGNSAGDGILIQKALSRWSSYDFSESINLIICKYDSLWSNNFGSYGFVYDIVDVEDKEIISSNSGAYVDISRILTMITVISVIIVLLYRRGEENHWLFIEIFGIGYILSNLIVCLNGRYNIPLYPVLLICCSDAIEYFMQKSKNTTNSVKKKLTKKANNLKILLIVPAYNEDQSIKNTIELILKNKYDYVVINDGSSDKTAEICKENKYNYISLVNNLGIGGAMQTGYRYAFEHGYDVAIQFDADGQHDLNYINDLIKPIRNGKAHLVIGSRYMEDNKNGFQSTRLRRFGNKVIAWFIKKLAFLKITDTTSGFRAADKEIISRFAKDYPTEWPEPVSTFSLAKLGYTVKEVPVKMNERKHGASCIHTYKSIYYMVDVLLSIIIIQIRGDKE